MESYSLVLAIVALILEATVILRAREGGFLSQFPLFYSYLTYVFCGSVATLLIYWVWPEHYSSVFWFYFLVTLLAEFAVLVEVSDHMFNPYPAIRRLGRLLTISVGFALVAAYVFPALLEPRPTDFALLDLTKRMSLTKGAIIIVLLITARYYRLPLGKNISGMLLGFVLYLGVNVANFAAAGQFGKVLYTSVLKVVVPVSYNLCLLVWTVALWRKESALPAGRKYREGEKEISEALSYQLGRFNTALTRLLRR